MCSGFFFISGLEEVLHHFLHPHQIQQKESKIKMNSLKETSYSNGAKAKADVTDLDEKESDKTAAQIKAAIRTVFVVSALSFHSTIEGKIMQIKKFISYRNNEKKLGNKRETCTHFKIFRFSPEP